MTILDTDILKDIDVPKPVDVRDYKVVYALFHKWM